jgi:hypothetical protein
MRNVRHNAPVCQGAAALAFCIIRRIGYIRGKISTCITRGRSKFRTEVKQQLCCNAQLWQLPRDTWRTQ